ncbi:MAG: hypothetical protein Q4B28_06550 [bacterium]|nr:hypothetical protein [bacterium]
MLDTTKYKDLTDHIKKIDEIYNDAMVDSIEDKVGFDLFDQKKNSNRHDNIKLNHGVAGVAAITEGQNFPVATGKEGHLLTLAKQQYGADVIVTKLARLYNEYDQVEENVRTIVDDGMNKIDQSLADILSNGFSTSAYNDVYGQSVTPVGANGKALFSEAHTNGATSRTFSNLIVKGTTKNPELSIDAIEAARRMGYLYKDPNGINRPIEFDTILVSPEFEKEALIMVNSALLPGTGNNDVNPYKGRFKVKVWSKLAMTSAGVDTSKQWYMFNSKLVKNTLKLFWAQHPKLTKPKEFNPDANWHYMFDFIYSRGFGWAPYIVGSKGTNQA